MSGGAGERRPRLILLTQWFDPEPTFKGLHFARGLAARGYDVEVVTGVPNYPGGKVYEGYRLRPLQREEIDGIRITRLPLYPSHDQSRIGRVLNYLSFAASVLFYLTFVARRADVLYAYHPPLTVGLAAVLARLVRRTPVLLDIQDLWPDTLRSTGMIGNERLLGLIGTVARFTYGAADHVTVLSPGFRRLLMERGVPAEEIDVVYNWADESGLSDPTLARPALMPADGRFRILFAGNMGKAQALDCVLQAAARVAGQDPRIEFCLLGSGVETARLEGAARAMGLPNVRFLPRVPMAEAGAYLAHAEALLVHLRADPLFAITIPSKTQAYLAAGRPLLMAVEGDAAALVERSGAGLTVPPEDPEALAEAALALARMPQAERDAMGRRGADFYDAHLASRHGIDAFDTLLRRLKRT